MSLEWIKWSKGLTRKPEVFAISHRLGISRREVAGALMEVWEWCDDYTEDGDLEISARAIDELVSITGFAEAMESVQWLENDSAGIVIPNFERHNGKSAKRRAKTQQRVNEHRERKKLERERLEREREANQLEDDLSPSQARECNAPVTLTALPNALPEQEQEIEQEFKKTTTTSAAPVRAVGPDPELRRLVVVVSSFGVCRAEEAVEKALMAGLSPKDVLARCDAFGELAEGNKRPGTLYNWLALPRSFKTPNPEDWKPKLAKGLRPPDERKRADLLRHGRLKEWSTRAIQSAVEKLEAECFLRYRNEGKGKRWKSA